MVPAVVAVVGAVVGCAHDVTVASNVPQADVRVDGAPIGKVKDGATFEEPWGTARVYDIEVTAPGHRVSRVQVKPTVVDTLGAPAMLSAVAGCTVSLCISPLVGLALLTSASDPSSVVPVIESGRRAGQIDGDEAATRLAAWSAAAATYGCTAASWYVVAGSQRLPGEIFVELVPESGVTELGLPPPPEDIGPLPPTTPQTTPPPPEATQATPPTPAPAPPKTTPEPTPPTPAP